MLVEPYAADRLEDNKGPISRLYYSASTTLCCAHVLSEGGQHVLGAQAGEARLADVFAEAGFTHWRLAEQTPFNLILEARPEMAGATGLHSFGGQAGVLAHTHRTSARDDEQERSRDCSLSGGGAVSSTSLRGRRLAPRERGRGPTTSETAS